MSKIGPDIMLFTIGLALVGIMAGSFISQTVVIVLGLIGVVLVGIAMFSSLGRGGI